MTLSRSPWWWAPVLASGRITTVPAQSFSAPARAVSIAAARLMPGVCGVFGSSSSACTTRTPLSRQSGRPPMGQVSRCDLQCDSRHRRPCSMSGVLRQLRLSMVIAALALFCATAAPSAAQAFTAQGSVEQVSATGLAPNTPASLLNSRGRKVAKQQVNALGGVLFRNVRPGGGYRVKPAKGTASDPLTVISTRPAPPSTDVYNQSIPPSGYGYLTTRDGTQLAYSVHPPSDVASGAGVPIPGLPQAPNNGPYPTLIEYSGYGYADPAGPQSGIAVLANLMGFAVVDVNMRGTGCSGGAFDFFEPLQNLDGYDVIETIAHQSWVRDNKVGMMGISYGAISQLFTAQLDPPDLEAISPLSSIDATATTLYPGGVLNTGFAVAWAEQRQHEAEPAGPSSGQAWAYEQIQSGDT